MFKKTKIAAVSAAVLGLSSMAAQAATEGGVEINTSGSQGEVLVFPYYNVNNGYTTAFNITNTTSDYKAVKIRFRESENSNDVLDFNLYMSPNDVFTMNLLLGDDDGVNLTTTDVSCTDPTIPAGGVLFRHQAYDSTDVADVREGYLEVIEMGVINEDAYVLIDDTDGDTAGNRQIITSGGILHANGLPKDCSVIKRAWLQEVFVPSGAEAASEFRPIDQQDTDAVGFPFIASQAGWYGKELPISNTTFITNSTDTDYNLVSLFPPTGGIVGSSILVDTVSISGFVAEPLSVTNYSTRAQHYLSSDENFYLLPSLASGSVSVAYESDNVYSIVERDWGMDDTNQLPRKSVPSGVNPMPLADALLVTSVANQYFLGPNTRTDWVISAPMRKHAIYNDYQYVAPGQSPLLFTPDSSDIPVGVGEGEAPSESTQISLATTNGYWLYLDADDVKSAFVYWDREENETQAEPGDFSPPIVTPDTVIPFEREVNILALGTIAGSESVLGSDNSIDLTLDPGFNDGWGRFIFSDSSYNLAGLRYAEWVNASGSATGVPLFGFMAAESSVGDQNVGESFPHFYD